MRPTHLAAVLSLASAILTASCVQSPPEPLETDSTGETAQPAYEDVFHFVVDVRDDGRGEAGGWQKATAILKFGDSRHPFAPYFWQCPIVVGMPIRTALRGRISPQYAAQISAEIATEATHVVMHGRESWLGQSAVFCDELYEHMRQMFRAPGYRVIGARVARL